jgi:hypothetical protein
MKTSGAAAASESAGRRRKRFEDEAGLSLPGGIA